MPSGIRLYRGCEWTMASLDLSFWNGLVGTIVTGASLYYTRRQVLSQEKQPRKGKPSTGPAITPQWWRTWSVIAMLVLVALNWVPWFWSTRNPPPSSETSLSDENARLDLSFSLAWSDTHHLFLDVLQANNGKSTAIGSIHQTISLTLTADQGKIDPFLVDQFIIGL
jgi:hypothetical protein